MDIIPLPTSIGFVYINHRRRQPRHSGSLSVTIGFPLNTYFDKLEYMDATAVCRYFGIRMTTDLLCIEESA